MYPFISMPQRIKRFLIESLKPIIGPIFDHHSKDFEMLSPVPRPQSTSSKASKRASAALASLVNEDSSEDSPKLAENRRSFFRNRTGSFFKNSNDYIKVSLL